MYKHKTVRVKRNLEKKGCGTGRWMELPHDHIQRGTSVPVVMIQATVGLTEIKAILKLKFEVIVETSMKITAF
jgi:hypothetical protein